MIARSGKCAELIAIAEIAIKRLMRECYFNELSLDKALKRAAPKIKEYVSEMAQNNADKQQYYDSLIKYAKRCYMLLDKGLNRYRPLVIAAFLYARFGHKARGSSGKVNNAISQLKAVKFEYKALDKGIPLQVYSRDYFQQVRKTLDKLAEEYAADSNSKYLLRNKAEMAERYKAHNDNIEALRASGSKLVVVSAHQDCSDRCAKWQGRVYSLDGTSGVTRDGKRYVPLEKATDIYHTTKKGKRYRNGLFGFNCRHKAQPYVEGMIIPTVSKEVQQREYGITLKQREYERAIIAAKHRAECFRGIDADEVKKAKNTAKRLTNEYIEYSQGNGRAYYPVRMQLL